MNIFDWFKPLDKVLDTVDKAVEDKDAANMIRRDLQMATMELRALAEQTYIAELNSKTIPWVDALHKMGRQIISVLHLGLSTAILIYMVKQGHTLTLETFATVMAMGAPGAAYNYVKGKGKM